MASNLVHKWTPEETRRLINFRTENEDRFKKSKYTSKALWMELLRELGLEEKVTAQQVSKKWENLKRKYKELRTPKTGSGTDRGETTAANWQYFDLMHEVLGGRPSVDPPRLIASVVCPTDAAESSEAGPSTSVACPDTQQRSPSHSTSGVRTPRPHSPGLTSGAGPARSPARSPGTPMRKRKRNPVLEYLKEANLREERRFYEQAAKEDAHIERTEAHNVRFGNLLERLVDHIVS